MRTNWAATVIAAASLIAPAVGKNVDLSTIPPRNTVQLTIYNSEDLTLVRETRQITFKQGVNPLQFSWANTLIDPTSVDLRFKTHADQLDLIDTTYPHDKPQMLYWNVRSEMEGPATVEITYFTSGITWAADYVCVVDPEETRMSFDGYVRITNHSGEDYANAQVRMVVGTINLVEKIAELSRRGLIADEKERAAGRRAVPKTPAKPARGRALRALGYVMDSKPKEIIKEGLSEYFIYTVEGTETIRNTWSKRMQLFEGTRAPFRIQYRYRPAEYGRHMVRLFLLRNDKASTLGTTPLPDGVVRLCRDNGRDGLSFLTQQGIKYVPIGQEIVLNLGPDPEVIHEWVLLRNWRDNFWFHRGGVNVHFSPTKGHRIAVNDTVAGWDDHQEWVERIRNYRAKPIDVEIRRRFGGHVMFRSGLNPTLYDYRTPQFSARVNPGQKRELAYRVTSRQGYDKKQDKVTLLPQDG